MFDDMDTKAASRTASISSASEKDINLSTFQEGDSSIAIAYGLQNVQYDPREAVFVQFVRNMIEYDFGYLTIILKSDLPTILNGIFQRRNKSKKSY